MSWGSLPAEVWEQILDLVDTVGLQSAQEACRDWREAVLREEGVSRRIESHP